MGKRGKKGKKGGGGQKARKAKRAEREKAKEAAITEDLYRRGRQEHEAGRLAAALRPLPAFGVTLSRLDRFVHGRRGLTAWLAPEPDHASSDGDDPWRALQALCQQAFPHCTDQTSRKPFVPHLTVGQFQESARHAAFEAAVAAHSLGTDRR